MKIQGAVIREQGQTFAVVIVKKSVIDNASRREKAQRSFEPLFPEMPVVLMAQDSRGAPIYWGRDDIAKFMANVPLEAIPWKEYTVT